VPFNLYKNSSNLFVTTRNAAPAGYTLVSTEGYVFQDRPYSVLHRWWTDANEYQTTTDDSPDIVDYGIEWTGGDSAVLKYYVPGTVSLDSYYSNDWTDTFTSTYSYGGDYYLQHHEGYVFTSQVGGTVPLNYLWSDAWTDAFTTVLPSADGYVYQENMGYAYPLAR
jgi:hypothetical protein